MFIKLYQSFFEKVFAEFLSRQLFYLPFSFTLPFLKHYVSIVLEAANLWEFVEGNK